jgi:hypothetical protein
MTRAMTASAADSFNRSWELMAVALLVQRSARALRRRGRPEMQGGSGGATLVERIGALVRARQPFAYCIPCLAVVLRTPEKLVRDSAQVAIVQDGIRVERRTCRQCGRADDALSVKPVD